MVRKFFLVLSVIVFLLAVTYVILSGIPKNPLDKSEQLLSSTSAKSLPAYYAFGYQPELTYSEERQPCQTRFPNKAAMWGDLHIHTALSGDAFPDGTRTFPKDVYAFAKGAEIPIPTPTGQIPRTLTLQRPLDFAAVTDHAEAFGEAYICTNPGAFPGYDSKPCEIYRSGGDAGVRIFMTENAKILPTRREEVCGENNIDCEAADKIAWQQTIQAAQNAYDKSADCSFTSFVGYEYTRGPNSMHMHRNTIFKNTNVPERPATHQSHPQTYKLLESFEQECRLGIDACDVISIPHNSNISAGNAFNPRALDGFSIEAQMANRALRNSFDRLMEIVQHKGISECINGSKDILGDVDELCDIEAMRQFGQSQTAFDITNYVSRIGTTDSEECSEADFDPAHNLYKGFCLSSRDFARGALLEGMAEETAHSINPFEFGFIGSTDTHISAAGHVDEENWTGHIAYETDLEGRLGKAGLARFNRLVSNPGGLAGVYATENSRDAIFQSMKRREAFATSGPRIEPRFFAGNFDSDICENEGWLSAAYENGTPMGSKLPAQNEPFQLLAQAKADPQSGPLTKLQIIKGWLGPEGHKHNQVFDLINTSGNSNLCRVFTDPDYDATLPTYYYVRAAEGETPRWSAAQCAALSENERPESCNNEKPDMIREMAWSSPIWFTPGLMQDLPAESEGHGH